MSKGSKRRPSDTPDEAVKQSWHRIFRKGSEKKRSDNGNAKK